MYPLLKPFLLAGDPEKSHHRTLCWAESAHRLGVLGLVARRPRPLPTKAFGLEFDNPVGLAAGMDKNGAHIDALAHFGFGFIEVGTVTPRPQPGNPQPRLFRIPERQAVINRMGFNNEGVDALVRNLDRTRWKGVIGVNIGKNKDTPNEHALRDYVHCLERVWDHAGYVVVNISSPNTAGLRELQHGDPLRALVAGLREAQERMTALRRVRRPVLVKIAPDLDERAIEAVATEFGTAGVDGVVATNTTLDRKEVAGLRHAEEAGGLSGAPLHGLATEVLRRLRAHLDPKIPIIGVGGILSGADAVGKLSAGALLVQFYTGLVYRGPALVHECVDAIRRRREQGLRR